MTRGKSTASTDAGNKGTLEADRRARSFRIGAHEIAARPLELAQNLAALPPNAIALSKRQFAAAPVDFETACEMEAMGQSICFEGTEFPEGVAAFKEKRKPAF